jgi:hypothetical protein
MSKEQKKGGKDSQRSSGLFGSKKVKEDDEKEQSNHNLSSTFADMKLSRTHFRPPDLRKLSSFICRGQERREEGCQKIGERQGEGERTTKDSIYGPVREDHHKGKRSKLYSG